MSRPLERVASVAATVAVGMAASVAGSVTGWRQGRVEAGAGMGPASRTGSPGSAGIEKTGYSLAPDCRASIS